MYWFNWILVKRGIFDFVIDIEFSIAYDLWALKKISFKLFQNLSIFFLQIIYTSVETEAAEMNTKNKETMNISENDP